MEIFDLERRNKFVYVKITVDMTIIDLGPFETTGRQDLITHLKECIEYLEDE